MNRDDRKVDRKADPDAAKPPEEPPAEPASTRRDVQEWIRGLRDRLPSPPDVPLVGVVVAALYAATIGGAVGVAYGATALAAAHYGTHPAIITAGAFAAVYGYVGISAFAHSGIRP